MSDDLFSLDQLSDMKFNICCRIDVYLEQAEGLLHRIEAFNSVEESESDSSSAALVYLHHRFTDVMKEFADCNEDLLRLEQIIQEKYLPTTPKKRIPEASDEEFLARVQNQYAYQMFGARLEDL